MYLVRSTRRTDKRRSGSCDRRSPETENSGMLRMKKESGITPAFPKLIYALDDDNITPDSKYWHLTN